MAASAALTAIGTAFKTAVTSTLGQSLIGGAIAGWGQAKMQEADRKEDERQRIAEEQRIKDSYAGVGEAGQFWDPPNENDASQGQNYERADAKSNFDTAVGQKESRARLGQQYRTQAAQTPRFQYDEATGRIVRG